MKKHKIVVFVIILSLISNFSMVSHAKTHMHMHLKTLNETRICNSSNLECVKVVRMQTPRLQYLYYEILEGIISEIKNDIPENYLCVIVKPKNRVQEARRNIDEYNMNICSKKC